MFGARLHPYKPPARARVLLEKLGLAARRHRAEAPKDRSLVGALLQLDPGLLTPGFSQDVGGAGSDPLLLALAVERIGEEGLDEGLRAVSLFAANSLINRWIPLELRRDCCRALGEGRSAWAVPLAWRLRPCPAAEDMHPLEGLREPTRTLLQDGWPDSSQLQVVAAAAQGNELRWYAARARQPKATPSGEEKDMGERLVEALAGTDAELVASDLVLQVTLLTGAAVLGALTDAFRHAGLRGRQGKLDAAAQEAAATDLADFGTDLEALRSFVIAAAELKQEWDSKPSFRFLPEVLPFLAELSVLFRRVATRSLERLVRLARLIGTGIPSPVLLGHLSKVWLVEYAGPNARDAAAAAADFYL